MINLDSGIYKAVALYNSSYRDHTKYCPCSRCCALFMLKRPLLASDRDLFGLAQVVPKQDDQD